MLFSIARKSTTSSSRVTGKKDVSKEEMLQRLKPVYTESAFRQENKQAAKNVLDDSVIVFCIAFFTL